MDTIESVLSHAHKVLIDGKAGSNMIYLPIDKLLEKGTAREVEAVPGEGASSSGGTKEPDQVTVEARGRSER